MICLSTFWAVTSWVAIAMVAGGIGLIIAALCGVAAED